jgi:PAS domain S-box-containing protein
VQLLSLSLLVVILDLILHLQSNKRNLLLSFLPTALMISSIGFSMMFNPVDLSYVFHYVLFACLLLIILIDYQYILKGVEAPRLFKKREPEEIQIHKPEPAVARPSTLFSRKAIPAPQPSPPLATENVADFKKISDAMVQRMQNVLDDLEKKAVRIEKLEKTMQQQNAPFQREPQTLPPVIPSSGQRKNFPVDEKNLTKILSTEEKIILKERIENHLIMDEMDHIVAVIQRGIFKDISHSFADFLGYERTELLQKNFFVFIAPRGFDDARKYYLNRLKGITTNSFKTVLLTKAHTEVTVEITVAPTVFKGDSAEFISIKEIKDPS